MKKTLTSRFMPTPRWTRIVATILLPLQFLYGVPIQALADTKIGAAPPPPVLTPQNVKVNRTVPTESKSWFGWVKWGVSNDDIFQKKVFVEPLVPTGGSTSSSENKALLAALDSFASRSKWEDASSIENFLTAYPQSPWRLSLLVNLGNFYHRNGAFSKAVEAYKQAWTLGKGNSDDQGRSLADKAAGELSRLYARVGDDEKLNTFLSDLGERQLTGSASENLSSARSSLWMMQRDPQASMKCGVVALAAVRRTKNLPDAYNEALLNAKQSGKGFQLAELDAVARSLGMDYEPVKAGQGAALSSAMLPAIAHWKAGHYSAILKENGGKFLVKDDLFPTGEAWVSKETLEAETSGHFLIPKGKAGTNWSKLEAAEAKSIIGRGAPNDKKPKTRCDDEKQGGGGSRGGMIAYKFHAMVISLHLYDFPLTYTPPVGPGPAFKIMYNQRDVAQPAIFSYSNFGPKWTMDLISYVVDDPGNSSSDVKMYNIGGERDYTDFNAGTQTFAPQQEGRDVLKRLSSSPIQYERLKPDGSREIYAASDGATVAGRKVFLTQMIDPQGNILTLHYDSLMRLIATTDAVGQVSTLTYGLLNRPYLITKITDPFGRHADFQYNTQGRLISITDVLGLQSSVEYGPGDFIHALTTPYGTTRFTYGEQGPERWLEATDPYGDKERIEYKEYDVANNNRDVPILNTESQVPTGVSSPALVNNYISERNTYYWDKKAMKLAPGDYSKARITHWQIDETINTCTGIVESRKNPFETRVWYTYPNQNHANRTNSGMVALPKVVARILPDGSTQKYQYTYNDFGNITNEIDPESRNFTYTYDTNGIDLLEVRQTRGSNNELMTSFTYNSAHRPLTETDASGETTTFTYNIQGQIATITNPLNETTTHTYDSLNRLEEIERPVSGATTNYTYDSYNRVRTITDSEGYTLTYDYDAMDRVTKVTYPDGTYTQTVYDRLDAVAERDREGRWTYRYYNALQQIVMIKDPLGRTTNYEWCKCGSLQGLTDPNGNVTKWAYNEQAQKISKTYSDGSKELYGYDNVGRLATQTDALNQVTSYEYYKDDNLKSRTYTGAINPTSNVAFTYSQDYNRITSMTDGSGTTSTHQTTYSYYPITGTPTLGAGRLQEINGSLSSDVIAFAYDELGRVIQRTVNSNSTTYSYDTLGRMIQTVNSLGTFSIDYINHTNRLETITYPNGLISTQSYYPNVSGTPGNGNGDQRLASISHAVGSTAISSFGYEYSVDGTITRWSRQTGTSTANVLDLVYDSSHRLLSGTDKQSGTPIKQYAYTYDNADNRTVERIDDSVKTSSYNNLNQITGLNAGGKVRFSGTTNEEASVSVNGQVANVTNQGKQFEKEISLPTGTSTVTIQAEDPSGNVTSQNYDVDVAASTSQNFTYDANGNLTADGTRQYAWDAENRLVKITHGALTTDIEYDGLHRRTRIVEKNGGTTLSDKRFIWNGSSLIEQRNGSSTSATQRYFPFGVQQGSNKYFFTRDHLRSIREVLDNSGSVVARYDYDLYGNRTKVAGTFDADFGYTGHYYHEVSHLQFALYRAYSANMGRWLSRDPAENISGETPELLSDSSNLYAYVANCPISRIDPNGLFWPGLAPTIAPRITPRPAGPGGFFDPVIDPNIGPGDFYDEASAGWICTATCNVQQIYKECNCPSRVSGGPEFSKNQDAACKEAKRQATQSTPRGCYPRHCKCKCIRGFIA